METPVICSSSFQHGWQKGRAVISKSFTLGHSLDRRKAESVILASEEKELRSKV